MRILPFLLLLATACSTITQDEKSRLRDFQQNAQLYFDGGKLEQSMGMIDRGLAIAPDDYKLQLLRASVLLRQSTTGELTDEKVLDESAATFAKVYAMRKPERHEPALLFNYAICLQKRGMLHVERAQRASKDAAAASAADAEKHRQTAAAEQKVGEVDLRAALGHLSLLLAQGNRATRLCHFHALQIHAALHEDDLVNKHGEAYLRQSDDDQKRLKSDIEKTPVYGYERERVRELEVIRSEQIDVRAFLAEHYYGRKDFARAKEQLDAILQQDPTRSADYYNRGRVQIALGKNDDAKADFRKFLATSPLPSDHPKKVEAVKALTQ